MIILQADLICVGNELLTGLIENSNAGFLSRSLWAAGITVRETCVVADNEKAIREALDRALKDSDIVILTGGLGPTDDDLTREAVASALDRPLINDGKSLEKLQAFFAQRGLSMPANNCKQAQLIEGGRTLENSRGTAPGMILEHRGRVIVLLPGPPNEMQPLFKRQVLPELAAAARGRVTVVKTLKCIGIGESMLEEKIKAVGKWDLPAISYVARGYEVHLQIKGSGEQAEAAAAVAEAERRLRSALGIHIYGSDDDTLAGRVAELFTNEGLTLATAESCSGGLLADLITDVPGSSSFYKGGLITYRPDVKTGLLGLDPELLEREGEVSASTAEAMAEAARQIFKADLGAAITGLAGPAGDSSGLPIGLVYAAVAGPEKKECKKMNLGGGRRAIKERAAQVTLDMLRKKVRSMC